MRILATLAALAALSAGSALAKEAPNVRDAAKDAAVTTAQQGGKVLYICDDTAMTRRAFAREFGQVEFVTADDVRANERGWSAPKCITSVEAKRLEGKRFASAR